MSKHIITSLLMVAALSAPITVFANIEIVNEDTRLAVLVETEVAAQKMPAQTTNLTQVEQITSTANNQLRPLTADVWLLSIALLGFVLLSNRSGI
jgi:hypothetical protein